MINMTSVSNSNVIANMTFSSRVFTMFKYALLDSTIHIAKLELALASSGKLMSFIGNFLSLLGALNLAR